MSWFELRAFLIERGAPFEALRRIRSLSAIEDHLLARAAQVQEPDKAAVQ